MKGTFSSSNFFKVVLVALLCWAGDSKSSTEHSVLLHHRANIQKTTCGSQYCVEESCIFKSNGGGLIGMFLGTVATIITAGAALPAIPVLAAVGRDMTKTRQCDCVRYDYRIDDTCDAQL